MKFSNSKFISKTNENVSVSTPVEFPGEPIENVVAEPETVGVVSETSDELIESTTVEPVPEEIVSEITIVSESSSLPEAHEESIKSLVSAPAENPSEASPAEGTPETVLVNEIFSAPTISEVTPLPDPSQGGVQPTPSGNAPAPTPNPVTIESVTPLNEPPYSCTKKTCGNEQPPSVQPVIVNETESSGAPLYSFNALWVPPRAQPPRSNVETLETPTVEPAAQLTQEGPDPKLVALADGRPKPWLNPAPVPAQGESPSLITSLFSGANLPWLGLLVLLVLGIFAWRNRKE